MKLPFEDDDADIVLNSNCFTQDRKRQAKTKADLKFELRAQANWEAAKLAGWSQWKS